MDWVDVILAARDEVEIRTGYAPTHLVVRQEIWSELNIDPITEDIIEVWELEGMKVSVADYLDQPYQFLINIEAI